MFYKLVKYILTNMKTHCASTILADHVENKIIEYIKENHLKPGDTLQDYVDAQKSRFQTEVLDVDGKPIPGFAV